MRNSPRSVPTSGSGRARQRICGYSAPHETPPRTITCSSSVRSANGAGGSGWHGWAQETSCMSCWP